MSELLGQPEAVSHMLRRHKVFGHLDTAVQVVHLGAEEQKNKHSHKKDRTKNLTTGDSVFSQSDLVRSSSRDKYSIS